MTDTLLIAKKLVFDFVDEHLDNIEQIYRWKLPKNLPNGFTKPGSNSEGSIALRYFIHNSIANDVESSNLQIWYVKEWGGVRSNSPDTLISYLQKSDSELISFGFKGIATWSKMLSTRKPEKYAIYDARVGFSLNAIQYLNGHEIYIPFKLLPSRNVSINKAAPQLVEKIKLLRKEYATYSAYLEILSEYKRTRGLANGVQLAEMVLFSLAPNLAHNLNRKSFVDN